MVELSKTKQRWYAVDVTIPAPTVGGPLPPGVVGRGTVVIENFPFLMTRVGTVIMGPNQLGPGGAPDLGSVTQDGQYTINFRTDHDNYMNIPLNAIAGFGSAQLGAIFDFDAPIELLPKQSIVVEVMNTVDRAAGIVVQVVFHGIEPRDLPPKV